jgi:deazaflavin-dependent oxidoreductase (nitroreductase family)
VEKTTESSEVELPEADWDLSKVSDDVWRHNTAELLGQVDRSGTTDSIPVELNGTTAALIVLHSTGAKTGETRRTPLIRIEHNGTYAVVASKGGAPSDPAWYHNITANPQVVVHDGTTTAAYTARETVGSERALWWERAVAAWPSYADYAVKTDRNIPVVVLEPVR